MSNKIHFILFLIFILLLAVVGCSTKEEPGLPNPASVYCEEQGGTLELRQEEGGVAGYCIFPDLSECEEWAYFRGECAPGQSLEPAGIANPASVYCEEQGGTLELRQEEGGVAGYCIFPDTSECDEWAYFRSECAPGDSLAAGAGVNSPAQEEVSDWWGVIISNPPGAQFDDYFQRQDLGQIINFGIESTNPAIQAQIVELRDSSKIVHLWGTLLSDVPDAFGTQIQVTRIEVD